MNDFKARLGQLQVLYNPDKAILDSLEASVEQSRLSAVDDFKKGLKERLKGLEISKDIPPTEWINGYEAAIDDLLSLLEEKV